MTNKTNEELATEAQPIFREALKARGMSTNRAGRRSKAVLAVFVERGVLDDGVTLQDQLDYGMARGILNRLATESSEAEGNEGREIAPVVELIPESGRHTDPDKEKNPRVVEKPQPVQFPKEPPVLVPKPGKEDGLTLVNGHDVEDGYYSFFGGNMKPKFFISGPMTGLDGSNRKEFHNAFEALDSKGYDVVTPTDIPQPCSNPDWGDWLRASITMMMRCDAVILLKGWEDSRGSSIEAEMAEAAGMPTINIADALKAKDLNAKVKPKARLAPAGWGTGAPSKVSAALRLVPAPLAPVVAVPVSSPAPAPAGASGGLVAGFRAKRSEVLSVKAESRLTKNDVAPEAKKTEVKSKSKSVKAVETVSATKPVSEPVKAKQEPKPFVVPAPGKMRYEQPEWLGGSAPKKKVEMLIQSDSHKKLIAERSKMTATPEGMLPDESSDEFKERVYIWLTAMGVGRLDSLFSADAVWKSYVGEGEFELKMDLPGISDSLKETLLNRALYVERELKLKTVNGYNRGIRVGNTGTGYSS